MSSIKTKNGHLGIGLYSVSEAGRLLHAHPKRIHSWLKNGAGLVPRTLDPTEQTITFAELMELHFIKMFRDEGVSLQAIREASAAAAKKFRTEYPFSIKRFDTDGDAIFVTLLKKNSNDELMEELRHGQLVFAQVCKPFFRKLEYRRSEVSRFWPMEKTGRVVLDPARKFGKPIDAETGISTQMIYDAVKAGGGQEPSDVARWLGIPMAAVNAAVDFERSMAA